MVSPIARREAVGWLQTRGTSLRRSCRVIGLSTATWRYQRQTTATNANVLARLEAHAAERARFGYRRLHVLLEREGIVVNQFQSRASLPQRMVEELKAEGLPVFEAKISSSIKIRESHDRGLPMIHLDARHKLSLEYRALYEELQAA
jgi:hypothetical protein